MMCRVGIEIVTCNGYTQQTCCHQDDDQGFQEFPAEFQPHRFPFGWQEHVFSVFFAARQHFAVRQTFIEWCCHVWLMGVTSIFGMML